MDKPPLSVIAASCVYIATGAIGFAFHAGDLKTGDLLRDGALWIELVRLSAVVAGVFILFGRNWARWLAMAWIALHVVLSFFHSLTQVAIHCVFAP